MVKIFNEGPTFFILELCLFFPPLVFFAISAVVHLGNSWQMVKFFNEGPLIYLSD